MLQMLQTGMQLNQYLNLTATVAAGIAGDVSAHLWDAKEVAKRADEVVLELLKLAQDRGLVNEADEAKKESIEDAIEQVVGVAGKITWSRAALVKEICEETGCVRLTAYRRIAAAEKAGRLIRNHVTGKVRVTDEKADPNQPTV